MNDKTPKEEAADELRANTPSSSRISVLNTDTHAVSIGLKLAQQKFYEGHKVIGRDVGGIAEFKHMAINLLSKKV